MLQAIPSLMAFRPKLTTANTLLNGLQAYYKLEDLTDSSGNGLTLTNTNSTTFIAGKVNNAAHFVAASSQRLNRADDSHFQMGTGSFTVAVWYKAVSDAAAGRQNIAVYGTPIAGGAGYGIWRWDNALQAKIVDSGGNNVRLENLSAFDGNWHLAVATFDRAGNLTLYVDNSLITTGDITGVVASVNNVDGFKFASNANFDADAYYGGDVDEYGLWNRVLTTPELSTLWNGGSGTTLP